MSIRIPHIALLRIALAASLLAGATAAAAQPVPADLTALPPVPKGYAPARTPWGDPDFRGTFPLENIDLARIQLVRPKEFGNRVWVTNEEFTARLATAKKSDAAYSAELGGRGTKGLAQWMETTGFAHRTSMLVSPADGQLPALTPKPRHSRKPGGRAGGRGRNMTRSRISTRLTAASRGACRPRCCPSATITASAFSSRRAMS